MSEDPLSFDQKLLDHPSKAELLNLMLLFEKLTILSKENYDFLLNTTEIPKEIRSILEILEKNNITLKEDDLKMLIQSKSLYLTFSFLAILKDSNCLNESTASILLNSCLNENTLLQGVDMLLNSEDYSKNEKFMSYTLDFLQGSFSETVDKKLYADTIIKAMSPYASESTPKLSFDAFKQSCIEKLLSICNKNGCRTVIAEDSFDVFPAASKRNNFFTAQDSSLVSTLQSLFNTIQAAKNISDIEKILEEKINLPHFEIFCDYVIKNKSSVKSEAAPTPTPKF